MMALFSFKKSRVNRLIRKSYAEQQTEPLVPLHQVITAMCSPTLATLYWERLALVACQYAFLSIQRDRHPRVITTVISWLPLGSNCSIGPADYTPSTHNLWPCGRVLAKATFTWTKGIRLLSNKLCVRLGGGIFEAECCGRVFVFQLQERAGRGGGRL